MTCHQNLSLMPSTPLPLNYSGPECCLLRHFFGRLCSKPPYHRVFPWPLSVSFIPITLFLQNTPRNRHRIFPNFIVCFPPLLCVYYSTIFCLQPFLYSNNYALRIKRIHFDKYFTSKWFSYFILMPSTLSLKRVDRVKFLLVSMMMRLNSIIMRVTVMWIIGKIKYSLIGDRW